MLKKTRNVLTLALIVSQLAVLTGCYTGIKAKQLSSEADAVKGLRYFLPAPMLVVDEIGPDKYDARIEYSVDRSQVFAVQPTQVMATSTATIEFNDDGTMKSFQLDQDSSDVPAAFVEGLRDLELKKLELEKAALDEASAKAEKAASGALAVPAGGARMVCIHRIHGDEPAAPLACGTVDVKPTGVGGGGAAAAEGPGTSIAVSPDGKDLVFAGASPLGTSDRNQIAFKHGSNALSDGDSRTLRSQTKLQGGKLVLSLDALRNKGVTEVVFGAARHQITH